MLDLLHIPKDTGVADVQIFTVPSLVTNNEWHTYAKPRGKTMLSITCVGGGAGGGGGFSAAAAAARGGGGGGGSSAVARLIIPFYLLPDILYLQIGAGGVGGAATVGGTAGVQSFVSVSPNNTTNNLVLESGNAAPNGGGAGTGVGVGSGGAAGGAGTLALCPIAGLGISQFTAGVGGSSGGAQTGAVGVAQAFATTGITTMGGTGGAGTTSADFAGGLITAVANSVLSDMRPQNAAAGSFDGCGGFNTLKPFFSFSGMGGGSSNAGVGGNGGNGIYGSGGGGGGGGTTGGRGGDGGGGITIMTAW